MAAVVDDSVKRRGSPTNYDNQDQGNGQSDLRDSSDDNNKQTLDLVNLFKNTLRQRIKRNESITEADVEIATLDARKQLNPDGYDPEKWKKDSLLVVDTSVYDIFFLSMAYAKTPEQIDSIFRAKQKQFKRSTSTHTQREPTRTSLENIIKPLKQLKDDMEHESLKNLFTAVLAINEDQIDRADRLFYSEVCHLVDNSTNYTFEIAHDQVQAIRLMHYEAYNEEMLRSFIQECRNFDAAYSYLLQLTRKRVNKSEPNASTQNNKQSTGSIVRTVSSNQNNDTYGDYNRLTNSDPRYNDPSQQQVQQGRNSLERGNSQREESDGRYGPTNQRTRK